jgi:hypothetical protein
MEKSTNMDYFIKLSAKVGTTSPRSVGRSVGIVR